MSERRDAMNEMIRIGHRLDSLFGEAAECGIRISCSKIPKGIMVLMIAPDGYDEAGDWLHSCISSDWTTSNQHGRPD